MQINFAAFNRSTLHSGCLIMDQFESLESHIQSRGQIEIEENRQKSL